MELIAYIDAQYCSVYFHILISWLHVLCDLSPINNDRKHAILAIFISVFFGDINFWWVVCLDMCIYPHNENDILYLGCQYTDLSSKLICYMFIENFLEFRQNSIK